MITVLCTEGLSWVKYSIYYIILPVLKNDARGNFVDRVNKKVMNFITCSPHFPGKHQHLNLSNGKLMNCFRGELIFGDRINIKNLLCPSGILDISVGRQILFTDTLYILRQHHDKQTTEYISKRGSVRMQVEPFFLNNEMPKKLHASPRINKSTNDVLAHHIK